MSSKLYQSAYLPHFNFPSTSENSSRSFLFFFPLYAASNLSLADRSDTLFLEKEKDRIKEKGIENGSPYNEKKKKKKKDFETARKFGKLAIKK